MFKFMCIYAYMHHTICDLSIAHPFANARPAVSEAGWVMSVWGPQIGRFRGQI